MPDFEQNVVCDVSAHERGEPVFLSRGGDLDGVGEHKRSALLRDGRHTHKRNGKLQRERGEGGERRGEEGEWRGEEGEWRGEEGGDSARKMQIRRKTYTQLVSKLQKQKLHLPPKIFCLVYEDSVGLIIPKFTRENCGCDECVWLTRVSQVKMLA